MAKGFKEIHKETPKKERKRHLKPQALRSAKERRRQLLNRLLSPAKRRGFLL